MKFGSVCSGIEAASVAWKPLGWEAAWLSEIEPFPCAVLKHHYPDVPNLGDMTLLPERILSGEIEAPDVFCGGTPCQAFSVAGLRNSLADARGNLSLVFCEIANAIDKSRSIRGLDQSIIFWENVPGVLSTKDNAFGCFLGALAGEDDALVPPGGRWTNAGFIDGPQRAVAWRVLDAQYFGVAQRRRRVFVVASARDDFDPAAVLFEFEGVRRDTAPSRETGKDVAVFTPGSIGGYRQGVGTLRANGGDIGGGSEHLVSQPFELGNTPHVAQCLTTGTGQRYDPETETILPVAYNITFCDANGTRSDRPNGGLYVNKTDVTSTLTKAGVGTNVVQPIVYAFDSLSSNSMKSSNPHSGVNVVKISKTLDTSRGLDPSCNQGGIGVAQGGRHDGVYAPAEVGPTMGSSGPPYSRTGNERVETDALAIHHMQVRRLTPVECERLQGFPDGYTNIPWRKASEAPDGPRYKALGNSWAVPVVRWIGERINAA